MNQILSTKLNNGIKHSEKKNWFKFQFAFSIIVVIILVGSSVYYIFYLQKEENFSNNLISNYSIYRLYNSSNFEENKSKNSNDLFRHYRNS